LGQRFAVEVVHLIVPILWKVKLDSICKSWGANIFAPFKIAEDKKIKIKLEGIPLWWAL
jgi:hypothetical protein